MILKTPWYEEEDEEDVNVESDDNVSYLRLAKLPLLRPRPPKPPLSSSL